MTLKLLRTVLPPVLLLIAGCGGSPVVDDGATAGWPEYGGDKGGLRYSPLAQITRDNVDRLEIAWIHRSGDWSNGSATETKTSFSVTPILVEDQLVFCTPLNRVIAVDPETGAERWSYDPQVRNRHFEGTPSTRVCRGVAYWRDAGATGACASRIFAGTLDSELLALDARTGQPCRDFGREGRVDLREGLDPAPPWERYPTSPPIVVRDVVVIGALVADNLRSDAPSGGVKGFDVRTGALRWAWDADPAAGAEAAVRQRYRPATPNVWSILSGDDERGLVFLPTGNAAPDLFGGGRGDLDRFGSSTVALDVTTGRVVWTFQAVHHDVWDYDVASQPVLFQLDGVGGGVPAVAQATKMGHVFLLDRATGAPLYPVEERPVPQGGVPEEKLAPTQPFPTHPAPLHPATLSAADAFGFTFIDRRDCAAKIARYRYDGIFTPPSLQGSIQYPSSMGGANWGSVAIDPAHGILYVNQTAIAQVVQLLPRAEYDRGGGPLGHFPDEFYPQRGTAYGVKRTTLLSKWGAPCTPTPWGTLTAVDLKSGRVLWRSPLGSTRDQASFPLWLNLGTPNLGGSIVTAGGLVFVGATMDKFLRAFDAESGDEIWRQRLPFTASATPMTYRLRPDGRQYVVIAAGGHAWSEAGDALIAFALR
ncbi:MAG: pyrroloquinoline quinone-dependent dehydrogenase [Gammaproteobacteria bacterium]|nr:pyrroloquinoline quinone-dependent dehydrogenase [Gammaproteobacteria bacterium]